MRMGKSRGLIIAGIGSALILAATLAAYRTPAPLNTDAAPTVFSAARAREVLKELVGDGVPHPMGSAADAKVRDRIVKRLTALGYTAELQTGLSCNEISAACGTPTNIVATRGAFAGKDAVMLAAHYDSVPAGPGASDDGVGVANLLEIARVLSVMPQPKHPVVLLVTDGEEGGLLGAALFAREHPLAKRIWAAVNMDTRGVSGPSLMFETGSANAWLMRLYGRSTLEPITNSLCYVIYKTLPNNTDFTVFKKASYQGFNLAFIGDVADYHTPLDSFENASPSTMQHQGANALSGLLALANADDISPPAADSLFFDVLARTVIVWPIGLVLPAALAALVLLAAAAVLLNRQGHLSSRQAAFGFFGALANVGLSGVVAIAVLALLRILGRLPPIAGPSWIAHPLAMHVGFAALALLSTTAIAAGLIRRAGFWGFWFGAGMLAALLSLASALLLPAAGYIVLLAALAAVLGFVPSAWALIKGGSPSQCAAEFAVLFPGLIALALLLPLLLLLYPALGAPAWPLGAVTLCITAAFLLPLLGSATRPIRQRLAVLTAATTFGAICITVLLPTYSASWPQRVNIEYWVDADSGRAHWYTQTASLHLPRAMDETIKFDPVPRDRFPGYPLKGFYAEAPALKLAAPELTRVSASSGSGDPGRMELLLRSARGAPKAFVIFPASANIHEIEIATPSGPLRAKLQSLRNGGTIMVAAGIAEPGLRFWVNAPAGPMTAQVFDESYELPADLPDARKLQQARPKNATSSQDGDITVVQRTVRVDPAAGR
ncbi:MAG TPA: M28 family peptidase [Steroidobacteraceae bacterium]